MLLLAENPILADNGHGSSAQKRFSGDGNSGAAEYKVWQRWARAALVVKKVGGMFPWALGLWIYTLLDGQAALVLESVNIKDTCTEGGEELVFQKLDHRFPDMVAADRMGEAMEEAFGLKIMKKETTKAFTGRSRLVRDWSTMRDPPLNPNVNLLQTSLSTSRMMAPTRVAHMSDIPRRLARRESEVTHKSLLYDVTLTSAVELYTALYRGVTCPKRSDWWGEKN